MELLLAVMGAAVAFSIGWAVGRSGDSIVEPSRPAESGSPLPGLSAVVEDLPIGIVVADERATVVLRNRAARSMRGTHVGVLIDEAIERHLTAAANGAIVSEELELYGPPRTTVDINARPLDGGGAAVVVQDVSERRRTDEIRTDFVANVSHELKTPIGAMSVLAETMFEETDVDTIHRMVERMVAEADRAGRVVDDLMELSRIELGGERADDPVRVGDIVRDGVERVTELAKQLGIALDTTGSVDAADLVVHGDRRQLVFAVRNLLENAIKYSATGSTVAVLTHADVDAVEIAVVDEGVGIPQRDLDRIFERFYRVDRARSRATGGTGLGLSIVRHVAGNHDGEVSVTSAEGEGSTFVLRLPLPTGATESPGQGGHNEGVA